MHSNRYTILYAISLTTIVAVTLAVAAGGFRARQERNIAQAKRVAILQSVMEVDLETLEQDYDNYIAEYVFNRDANEVADVEAFDVDVVEEYRKPPSERLYPVYVSTRDGRTHYIIPVEGTGLWGPIRGFVALEADLNTIYGVVFTHEKETPGLGAEIATPEFQNRFRGKKVFRDDGTFASVRVLRGTGNDVVGRPHVVDGLTGSTMTLNGVTRMLEDELGQYEEIIRELR